MTTENDLLLINEKREKIYKKAIKFTDSIDYAIDFACQTQLNNTIKKQEDALARYANGEISFEKLAELMGLNFYSLHSAMLKVKNASKE